LLEATPDITLAELQAELDDRKPSDRLLAQRERLESELELARELDRRVEELEARALDGFSSPLSALADGDLEPVWLSRVQIGMEEGGFQGFAVEAQDVTRFVEYLGDRELFRGLSFEELDIERTGFRANASGADGEEGTQVYRFTLTTPGMSGLGEPPEDVAWADPDIPDLGADQSDAETDEADAEPDGEESP
ncbi:MAG: hypothetical protein ACOC1T_03505, partial [Halorhodospira sp.]